eukprot:7478504-Heterocapsa_arctica.AAC.1
MEGTGFCCGEPVLVTRGETLLRSIAPDSTYLKHPISKESRNYLGGEKASQSHSGHNPGYKEYLVIQKLPPDPVDKKRK